MKKRLLQMSCMAALAIGIANNAAAQWSLTGNAGTGTSFLGTTNNFSLRMYTNNTQRMIVDSLGRVGIGTAKPINILTVKGAGSSPAASWVSAGAPLFTGFGEQTVGNSDYILSMASTLSNARPVFIGRRSKGTLAAPLTVANNDYLMSFLASGYDGSAFQNPAAIDFYVDGTPAAGSVPTRISFVTGSNGTNRAERLKIGNTGDVAINTNQLFVRKVDGKVGIGTSSPTANLDVVGFVKIADGSQGAGKVLTSDASGLASWTTPSSSSSPWTLTGNDISNNNSGNVGIGTATPTARLQVTSLLTSSVDMLNLSAPELADGTFMGMYMGRSSDSANRFELKYNFYKSSSKDSNNVAMGLAGNGNTIVMTGNGNVGIGTQNPIGKLDVRGKDNKDGGVLNLGNADNSHRITLFGGKQGDPNPFMGWKGGDPMRFASFKNGFSEYARFDTIGRFGIGTQAPNGQFELSLDEGRKPSTSTWTITSDARLKNIDGAYTKGLAEIMQLNPIAYHYKNVGNRRFDDKVIATQAIGYAAQDVQKVFPEAVGTDADGYLNLNIHPILIAQVNAIKEQQSEINDLKKEIAELKAMMTANASKTGSDTKVVLAGAETASIEQNAPNPFNGTTVIKYHLPTGAKNAFLNITNATGVVVKSITLTGKENGQVTLGAGTLRAGSYFYSLMMDGRKVATKEMELVK